MPTDLGQILDTKMTLLIISYIVCFLVIIKVDNLSNYMVNS